MAENGVAWNVALLHWKRDGRKQIGCELVQLMIEPGITRSLEGASLRILISPRLSVQLDRNSSSQILMAGTLFKR